MIHERRTCASQDVAAVTAPGVLPQQRDSLANRTRPHRLDETRVQVHIAAEPQHIRVPLDEPRSVTTLHEMPTAMVTMVEMDRVGRLQPVHEPPEIGPRRLHDQMDVVCHEAIEVQPHFKLSDALGEYADEMLAVPILPEDRLPLIASDRHRVYGSFVFDPLWSGHSLILPSPCLPANTLTCILRPGPHSLWPS